MGVRRVRVAFSTEGPIGIAFTSATDGVGRILVFAIGRTNLTSQ